ncbi:hypothetical protein I4Q36_04435 [Tuanshanicoccus lijuaniae]|uniref:hypothetical protein n=1 Tax=Aerococcaceae bacterium zg-1292 TaxID=2774330 RepID=UPI001934CA6C|nr:hypothetical protein [Aerococcaceae bacterium zg-1292]QQA37926.1 hypothetical protein I4Q36_04435 [Aerococcaceae bacterium zg-1292]
MSKVKAAFDALLKEKEIPTNYKEIEGGHHLYRLQFRASESRVLVVEIILQNGDQPYVDCQVIYRNIHILTDYNKRQDALDVINELNEMHTGYYHLFLALDGEIFLRSLMRIGEDVTPLYETIVYGSSIGRNLMPKLAERLGESGQVA